MREYIVRRQGRTGRWVVHTGQETYGSYLSEFAALQDAVDAAYVDGKCGIHSRVLSQSADAEPTVRWAYGKDAYPYDGSEILAESAPARRSGLWSNHQAASA